MPLSLKSAELQLERTEFDQIRRWLHQATGIAMAEGKLPLVAGRLARRVMHHGLDSYGAYFRLVQADAAERQVALDLLTTNETHFFREPSHFDWLRRQLAVPRAGGWRVWSAAASTGQEAYSLAMVLAEALGDAPWEVLGTDISSRVIERACSGLYDMALAREIPPPLLQRHCLRGVGSQSGRFLIAPALLERVRFAQLNLVQPLPEMGRFDLIFLRNVMIYFDEPTKRQVVSSLASRLQPGGWLVVGHSESLGRWEHGLRQVQASVFERPG